MNNNIKPKAFGGVVIDKSTKKVLLCQPESHQGGYFWTFPKAVSKSGELPEETATRAVQEKSRVKGKIEFEIPGIYLGETTENHYYLITPLNLNEKGDPKAPIIQWVDQFSAKDLINQTTSNLGRNRDLGVLSAAYKVFDHLERIHQSGIRDYHSIEREILNCAALRFDGYKYKEESGFDWEAASDIFFDTGRLPESPLEQMSLFFCLQRFLMKWGGEMLPETDPHWKLFRTLFLSICTAYVPTQYRPTFTDAYERWYREFFPRLVEYKAIVELIHMNTKYTANE